MTRKNLACPKLLSIDSIPQAQEIPKKFLFSLNFVLDPAVLVDVEANLIATNDKLLETTGYSEDELVGENLLRTNLFSSKNRVCLTRKCIEKYKKRCVDIFEIELNKKNGEKISTEVKMKKIKCGKKTVCLIVFHDITAMKNREKILEESEKRYLAVCEDARILILDLDLKGNICYANHIAESYGITQEDVIGRRNLLEFVSKENYPRLVSAHLSVVSGKKVDDETEIITSKGIFAVNFVSSPIRKEDKIVGCHIGMIDITDKKQTEKKFEKYADSALSLSGAYRDSLGY
jgi:PAS domain S-box-containing protein